jgi:hypothetical protein
MTLQELRGIDTAYFAMYPSARDAGPVYFIFDEIHRIDGWEDYVLYLLDNPAHRVLITGSTSRLLSGDIASALRGKCRTQELSGFSFREFLRHLGIAPDPVSLAGKSHLQHAFTRYLAQGSYPELFKYESTRHREILQEYWKAMLVRDVVEAHARDGVNYEAFTYFAQSLISRTACPFTVRRLMAEMQQAGLGCSPPSAYAYLRYLKEAFAVDTVSVFTESVRVRQRNYQKVYACDWALAEAVSVASSRGSSRALETLVYRELKRRAKQVSYLTHSRGGEIDFVSRSMPGGAYELIQVCGELTDENTARELNALPDACRYIGTGSATVVTLWEEREALVDGLRVRVVPAWRWLLEN